MKLPTFQDDVPLQARPTGPTADPSAWAAPFAQTAAGAAEFADKAFNAAGELIQQQHREAFADGFKRLMQARVDSTKMVQDAQAAAPEGAPNFALGFNTLKEGEKPGALAQQFDDYAQQAIQNAPEPTRPYLAKHLEGLRAQVGEQAMQFESQQQLAKRQSDLNDTVNLGANVVRSSAAQFPGALVEALQAVQAAGLPADQVHKAETHVKGMFANALVEGLNDKDPKATQQLLSSGKFQVGDQIYDLDSYLLPQVKNQLVEHNNAIVAHQDREVQAAYVSDVKQRLSNEFAAIDDRGYGTGALAPGMLEKAFGPDEAKRLTGLLSRSVAFYNAKKSVSLNSSAQDDALLARFKPEGNDYAIQAPQYHALEKIIETKRSAAATAEQKATAADYSNAIDQIRDSGKTDFDAARLRSAFPDQANDLTANLDREAAHYQARQEIPGMSPAEESATVAQFAPDGGPDYKMKAQQRNEIVQAIQQKHQMLSRDPVGYAVGASPVLKKAFDDAQADPTKLPAALTLSEQIQTHLGLLAYAQSVLSVGQAQDLVGKITTAPPDQAASLMVGLSTTYGDRWPSAWKDLVAAKLPVDYQWIGSVERPSARTHLVEAIRTGEKTLKEVAGKDATKTITNSLDGALDPIRDTFAGAPNGIDITGTLRNYTELLALRYTTLGSSPSTAVKRAVDDLVNSKWDIVQGGVYNARTPKGLADHAQDLADATLAALKAGDVAVPPRVPSEVPLTDAQRETAYFRDGVKSDALWVSNPRDDGWILLDAQRLPVRRRDGSTVGFTFDQATQAAQDAARRPGAVPLLGVTP